MQNQPTLNAQPNHSKLFKKLLCLFAGSWLALASFNAHADDEYVYTPPPPAETDYGTSGYTDAGYTDTSSSSTDSNSSTSSNDSSSNDPYASNNGSNDTQASTNNTDSSSANNGSNDTGSTYNSPDANNAPTYTDNSTVANTSNHNSDTSNTATANDTNNSANGLDNQSNPQSNGDYAQTGNDAGGYTNNNSNDSSSSQTQQSDASSFTQQANTDNEGGFTNYSPYYQDYVITYRSSNTGGSGANQCDETYCAYNPAPARDDRSHVLNAGVGYSSPIGGGAAAPGVFSVSTGMYVALENNKIADAGFYGTAGLGFGFQAPGIGAQFGYTYGLGNFSGFASNTNVAIFGVMQNSNNDVVGFSLNPSTRLLTPTANTMKTYTIIQGLNQNTGGSFSDLKGVLGNNPQ